MPVSDISTPETTGYSASLDRIEEFVTMLLDYLEEYVALAPDKEAQAAYAYLWGEKENALSILTKVTALMSKLHGLQKTQPSQQAPLFTEQDQQLLDHFIEQKLKDYVSKTSG